MFQTESGKVALVTDSACDLSQARLAMYDIRRICLRVETSVGEFRDGEEISPERVLELAGTERLRTAPPMMEDAVAVLLSLREAGCDRVLCLITAAGLSGTYALMEQAALEVPGLRTDVFDTGTVSWAHGLLVLQAAEDLASGMSADAALEDLDRVRATQVTCFVPGDPACLRREGRVSRLDRWISSLRGRPVLALGEDGTLMCRGRLSRKEDAVDALCREITEMCQSQPVRLAVVYSGDREKAERLQEQLCGQLQADTVFVEPLGAALTVHTGAGLLGAVIQSAG